MISTEEIKKLADLARIEIKEEEAVKLASEIDAILGFVGQVSSFASEENADEVDVAENHNVLREDVEILGYSEKYAKDIVAEFPDQERGYLKVKKIL